MGDAVTRMMAAFQAGQDLKMQQEMMAQREQERLLRQKLLDFRVKEAKLEAERQKRQDEIEQAQMKAQALSGLPAAQLPQQPAEFSPTGAGQMAPDQLPVGPEGTPAQIPLGQEPLQFVEGGGIQFPVRSREDLRAEKIQEIADALQGIGARENLVQSIRASYKTPEPTLEEKVREEEALAAARRRGAPPVALMRSGSLSGEGGKPLLSGEISNFNDIDNGLKEAQTLYEEVVGIEGGTGTVSALGAAVPDWVTDLTGIGTGAKQRQSVIDRVKQIIGKSLEGGVLRKEDEAKYKKILPTISDTSEVAKTKINGLVRALQNKREIILENYQAAGRDVTNFIKPAMVGGTEDPLGLNSGSNPEDPLGLLGKSPGGR